MQLSDILPAEGKILIRKDDVKDITEGGIILGINDKGRCVTGTVLSGPLKDERVVFDIGVTSTFTYQGQKLTVIFESDIVAYL